MKSISAAELIAIMGDRWAPQYRRPSGAKVYPPTRYVYFAKTASGFSKVGISDSVGFRLYTVSRQFGEPHREIIRVSDCAIFHERTVHDFLMPERQLDYSREHYWGPKTSRLVRDICFSRKS